MTQNKDFLIRTDDLNLRFGGVLALHQVSTNVAQSEILAIIGPNGAGKSCLLNCMNGFYHPQEGHVFFESINITHFQPHQIAKLGVSRTFQGIQLFQGLSVIDNLLTGRNIYMRTNSLLGFLYRGWAQ